MSFGKVTSAFCSLATRRCSSVASKRLFNTTPLFFNSSPHQSGCLCCGVPAMLCARTSKKSPLLKQFNTFKHSENYVESDCEMKSILANNKKWIEDCKKSDPDFFKKLSMPQKPKYLYFGCSDSRVPANEIMGLGAGEVFVHRNVGNLVPGNDLNVLAVLEFAVGILGVTDIVVAGHYGCGAIKAATARQDLGMLENWLRQIRDVYRLHKEYLDIIHNEESRQNALVELNVVEQCLNIYKTGVVQRKRIMTKNELIKKHGGEYKFDHKEIFPRIHGMVFNHADGVLSKIPVDFKRRVGSLDHIYGLYSRANPVLD